MKRATRYIELLRLGIASVSIHARVKRATLSRRTGQARVYEVSIHARVKRATAVTSLQPGSIQRFQSTRA